MVTKISTEQWMAEWKSQDIINPMQRCICVLPFSVNEIEEKYGLSFEYFDGDGLGECFGESIAINHFLFWLQGSISRESKEMGISVFIKQTKTNPVVYLNAICKAFSIKEQDLQDVNREWLAELRRSE